MPAMPPTLNVLLLEDDIDLGQAVTDHLEAAGHAVHWCKLISQVRDPVSIDFALLDLQLPDGDALGLLRQWRTAGQRLPVLVMTARDQVSDRIRGLEAGADDYLVKPFDLDEMLARMSAIQRRTAPHAHIATVQGCQFDMTNLRAWRHGMAVDLTAMEWTVLRVLSGHIGRIYSRHDIESMLVSEGLLAGESNTLEVIISRLRKKLGATLITTHRGLGYRLES
jgi:two-component system OmpR family response regulator